MKNNRKLIIIIPAVAIVGILLLYSQSDSSLFTSFQSNNDQNISQQTNVNPLDSSIVTTLGIIAASGSSVLGSLDAPVTIVEFGDYQCPNCKAWFKNTFPEIKEKLIDTSKANFYFVDGIFFGDDSLKAAEAAYCAQDQNKFWEYHDILFTNQQEVDNGWANLENLKEYASELNLDLNTFEDCLDSGMYQNKVKSNVLNAEEIGITKAPVFVIFDSDGRHHIIKGGVPFGAFENIGFFSP